MLLKNPQTLLAEEVYLWKTVFYIPVFLGYIDHLHRHKNSYFLAKIAIKRTK